MKSATHFGKLLLQFVMMVSVSSQSTSAVVNQRWGSKVFRVAIIVDSIVGYGDHGWAQEHFRSLTGTVLLLRQKYPNVTFEADSAYDHSDFVSAKPACSDVVEGWARQGINVIIIAGFSHYSCYGEMAKKYGATYFLHIASEYPTSANYIVGMVKVHQPAYLAGFTAGTVGKTRGHTYGALLPLRIPECVRDVSGWILGVLAADRTAKVYVLQTNTFGDEIIEPLSVEALKREFNVDSIYVRGSRKGLDAAQRSGMLSTGHYSDQREIVGNSVLSSAVLVWDSLFETVITHAMTGYFEQQDAMRDFWISWADGGSTLSALSFVVSQYEGSQVAAEKARMMNTYGGEPFCGTLRTQDGVLVNKTRECLNHTELRQLTYFPYGTVEVGTIFPPSEVCPPGTSTSFVKGSINATCTLCRPGTYSLLTNGLRVCTSCPYGTYSERPGARECQRCTYIGGQSLTECIAPTNPVVYYVPAIAIGVLLIAIAIAVILGRRHVIKKRILAAVPSKAAAIVFTDIESSTTLWSQFPKMKDALDLHNAIMRQELKRFNGYEVKTEGDAFMIAFHDAPAAASFCVACQDALNNANWDPELCHYEAAKNVVDGDGKVVMRGLRVRMGYCFGEVDIEYNPKRACVDYFGRCVNKASRISDLGHGGQILTNHDTMLLTREKTIFECKWLGSVLIRGFNEPDSIYQVECSFARNYVGFREKQESGKKSDARCSQCLRPCRVCNSMRNGAGNEVRRHDSRSSVQPSSSSWQVAPSIVQSHSLQVTHA